MSRFEKYYITPAIKTFVDHREECIPYYDAFYFEEAGGWSLAGAHLPIFVAPMACIVDDNNWKKFDSEGLNVIIPRTIDFDKRLNLAMEQLLWIAVGLDELEEIYNLSNIEEMHVCLDIANGHMASAIDLCSKVKEKFGNKIILMFGNIANADTYFEYAKAGIDYCRVGIGDGQACLTNTLTGISQDFPKIIKDLNSRKEIIASNGTFYKSVPKIVIDGGMSSVRDIIIALAMGADYVMCGKIFAQCEEAAGEIVSKLIETVEQFKKHTTELRDYPFDEDSEDVDGSAKTYPVLFDSKQFVYRRGRMYYGMSTERAQREMGNKRIKPAEGKEYWIPIEYKLSEWVHQFVAAIASTMSYCNVTQLKYFIGRVTINKYD